jgi:adenylate cyclase
MERRLAAILAADVAGYSRLMGEDEAGTLAALTRLRKEVIEPLIATHRGRVAKLMGDGFLVEFQSVVDAVSCAVAWQGSMATERQKPTLRFRIGVNLGDIIIEDGDIYGDGVNLAARLQEIADPGGVCLSSTVFEHVDGRVDIVVDDRGEQHLKNIAKPVRVYAVRIDHPHAATIRSPEPQSLRDKPSIAVLPFTNMSGDSEQEYFADGITEDIITDLSQVSALFVVARNTAFTYKGKAVEVTHVVQRLNVGYILQGSIRKAANRVRINVQLIAGVTGDHLWAKRFDRDLADIFALQDEISKSVVAALKLKLLPKELKAISTRSTTNAQAYELYLQARAKLSISWSSKEYLRTARRLFVKAAKMDPGYARAYAGIADCDAFLWVSGDLDVSYEQMLANSTKALELAPNLAEAHASQGVALYVAGHPADAIAAFDRATSLDSGLFEAHFFCGLSCRDTGDFHKAAVHCERAAELQSKNYQPLAMLADVHTALGHRDQNVSAARGCLSRIEDAFGPDPEVAEVLGIGATVLIYLGDNARAEKWVRRAVLLDPESYTVRYNAACTYAVIGKLDLAQECIEFAFSHAPRARGWLLGIAKYDKQLDPLRALPDFQNLMKRLETDTTAS